VRSLTSIMSNTGSRRSGQPSLGMYPLFLRRAPRERSAFIEHTVRVFEAIGSSGLPREERELRELAALSYDRGNDPAGVGRQLAAIGASGDRTAELHRIAVPTLVIHGCEDRLVAPSGGRATARAIPGSRLVLVPGMGHDMPRAVWARLIAVIADHTRRADARAGERLPLQTRPAPVAGLQG
jgi:pimeloyl-ACP methyl ester carboxylesterase